METTGEAALPRFVELAWGLDESGRRGPKRGLSLDEILDAAIELADEEGVAALSMARVAKRLGFTTMSLYRYVESKDELLELIADRVIGAPPDIPANVSWRAGLETWARAEYDALMRHRWWLRLPIDGAPLGPNNIAWLEAALRCLASTRLPEALKVQVALNVSVHVIGRARFTADLVVNAESDNYAAILPRLIDPTRFPALTAALDGAAFAADDVDWEDSDFRFALGLLLDGVERIVSRYESGAAGDDANSDS
ncbi:TetR family transcriptional regulator [Rhodococcus hoagii]|jgi:AcrR family transcriptional regulator|uniref:Transcriptional regulator, TetR family n=3 Tax=Rhodococcus hoagii TaxID=43767 RepID=E9T4K4_RHOHA|nr:TetR/AcrR family transcriptional regulator [Prescottella equi]MCD7051582.1 TetR/AcrR family transcriptional regulator [Rhodococcus sp. BH2-1]GBF13158.1 tetracycline repressor protein class E [Rhodococcus sp. Br-6]AVP69324.1 TetR/AcrR family transcriptional regulator [Prescottella equi]EGD22876.1 transcriptional regulator, TetR family [Prescottella equi ATCC 33707]ERN45135.1 tetr family transcriptional regulator [Prescottella equi NBRC 101255 = C 7]